VSDECRIGKCLKNIGEGYARSGCSGLPVEAIVDGLDSLPYPSVKGYSDIQFGGWNAVPDMYSDCSVSGIAVRRIGG